MKKKYLTIISFILITILMVTLFIVKAETSVGQPGSNVITKEVLGKETTLTVANKINNPKTADNLTHYIIMLSICITGLVSSTIFLKKNNLTRINS